jgi:hypothetical protein
LQCGLPAGAVKPAATEVLLSFDDKDTALWFRNWWGGWGLWSFQRSYQEKRERDE